MEMPTKYFEEGRLGVVLACVIFIPTIWYVGFNGSSYALGTFAVALVALCVRLPRVWEGLKSWRDGLAGAKQWQMYVLGALALQSVLAIVMAENFYILRFLGSLAGLVVLWSGAVSMAKLLGNSAEESVERILYWVTGAILLMAFLGALGLSPMADTRSPRPLFIFSEPSHFVLIFAPFGLWAVVKSRRWGRLAIFASILILLLFVKNMILLLLVGFAALVALRIRALVLIAGCLLAIMMSHPNYFLARLDFSGTTHNLSVLVWLQGWEVAAMGLKDTYGVGLGFQQMGLHGAYGEAALRIAQQLKISIGLDNGTLNLLDGGTLGAKLSAELGVLGIVVVLVCSYWVLRGILKLRVLSRDSNASPKLVFFYCCIASFAFDLYVRGTGFFAPWVLLFLMGLYGAQQTERTARLATVPSSSAPNVRNDSV